MQGISKEMLPRLMDKISDLCDNEDNIDYYIIEKLLISECTELNPWLPIEQAPKDREIVVYAPPYDSLQSLVMKAKWHPDAGFCIDELRTPTHYQELPPPKCNT